MKVLILIFILGTTNAAFGHNANGNALANQVASCAATGDSGVGAATCEQLCLEHPVATAGEAFCDDFPGSPPDDDNGGGQNGIIDSFNDNFIPIGNTLDDDLLDIDTGRGSDVLNGNFAGNSSDDGNNRDNQTQSGNTANNNAFGSNNNSGNSVGDLFTENDIGSTGDIASQINCGSTSSGNTCGENIAEAGSIDRSGNSANFNTDRSTQTITDGATTVVDASTQTITDGDQTVDSNDDNRVTDNSEIHLDSNDKIDNSNEDTGNSEVSIDQSDNSVNDNSVVSILQEQYRAPALSTQLNVTTSHCINFIGIQFSGAKSNGAAAMGLGIPMRDQECRLEKAAVLAFQMENYEAGWTAYCNQKSVRTAWKARVKAEAVKTGRKSSGERKSRNSKALLQCMQTGIDVQETLQSIHSELELLRKELVAVEGTEADSAALKRRIRTLEAAAHNPNETFLLQRIEE